MIIKLYFYLITPQFHFYLWIYNFRMRKLVNMKDCLILISNVISSLMALSSQENVFKEVSAHYHQTPEAEHKHRLLTEAETGSNLASRRFFILCKWRNLWGISPLLLGWWPMAVCLFFSAYYIIKQPIKTVTLILTTNNSKRNTTKHLDASIFDCSLGSQLQSFM